MKKIIVAIFSCGAGYALVIVLNESVYLGFQFKSFPKKKVPISTIFKEINPDDYNVSAGIDMEIDSLEIVKNIENSRKRYFYNYIDYYDIYYEV